MRTVSMCWILAALVGGGCASHQVIHERGWIGGEFLLARIPSRSDSTHIVPAFPQQLGQKAGVFVARVYNDSPLAEAGVREGDLILRVNDQPVETVAALRRIIDELRPGSKVSIALFCDGHTTNQNVTIGRETYRNWHTVGVGIPLKLTVDPVPNPDFSLIALGYSRNKRRLELNSPQEKFVCPTEVVNGKKEPAMMSPEGWNAWLAIFSLGSEKQILSQDTIRADHLAWSSRQ